MKLIIWKKLIVRMKENTLKCSIKKRSNLITSEINTNYCNKNSNSQNLINLLLIISQIPLLKRTKVKRDKLYSYPQQISLFKHHQIAQTILISDYLLLLEILRLSVWQLFLLLQETVQIKRVILLFYKILSCRHKSNKYNYNWKHINRRGNSYINNIYNVRRILNLKIIN